MVGAKRKVQRKSAGGPFLAAAVFCDTIIEGVDGVLSAIRIIDQVNVAIPANAPPNMPSDSQRLAVAIRALLMFKAGSKKGEHEVCFAIYSPSGKRTAGPKQRIIFSDSPSGGANLKIQLSLAIAEEGLYMVDVLLDGKRITRMPLVISITREEEAPSEPAPTKRAKPKRKRG